MNAIRCLTVPKQKYILRAYGLRPWLRLVQDSRLCDLLAQRHYEAKMKRQCFSDWLHLWRSAQVMKRLKADKLYQERLKQKCLAKWVKVLVTSLNSCCSCIMSMPYY